MRKGQITAFIIAGILVLVVLGLVLFFWNRPEPELQSKEAEAVSNFIRLCAEGNARSGIAIMAMQGGRIWLAPPYHEDNLTATSFGLYYGTNTLPSRSEMEKELARYIDASIASCLDNFSAFPGVEASIGKALTTTQISERQVLVRTDLAVSIEGTKVKQLPVTIQSDLGLLHSIASAMADDHAAEPDWVSLSPDMPQGVQISFMTSGDALIVAMQSDSLVFMFAEATEQNNPPVLELPASIETMRDSFWSLDISCIDPEGDAISVNEDSAQIEMIGSIASATPPIPGEYPVTFTCADNHSNSVSKKTLFRVIP
jgi:hypothetical protein